MAAEGAAAGAAAGRRVLVFGWGAAAERVLRELAAHRGALAAALCVSHGQQAGDCDLREVCAGLGFDCELRDDDGEVLAAARRFAPDLIVSASYRRRLPGSVLGLCADAVNFHPSLLPKHRGCWSGFWAIFEGDAETGVTCHRMVEAFDRGRILHQERLSMEPSDTSASLYRRLLPVTAVCARHVLGLYFGSAKARRLAALARRGCSVSAVVDSPQSAELLAAASRLEGVRLGVLVDVNVGQDRCGVDTPAEAVALAQALSKLEELHFRGIQAYQGLAQHIRNHSERAAAAAAAAGRARDVAGALEEAGFPCEVVTGGGTGTYELDAASGVFTEVQPGSYVFGDVDYSRNLDAQGEPVSAWRQSLFVAATVISRNTASRRVVLDAGLKAVSYDSGPPLVRGWPDDAARIESGGDEHTLLHVRPGTALPALGEQLLLVPGHCDPSVNLHDHLLGLRGGVVESIWPVAARGPGH